MSLYHPNHTDHAGDALAVLDRALAELDASGTITIEKPTATGMSDIEFLDYLHHPGQGMRNGSHDYTGSSSHGYVDSRNGRLPAESECWRCMGPLYVKSDTVHADGTPVLKYVDWDYTDGSTGWCDGCRLFILGVRDHDPLGANYYSGLEAQQFDTRRGDPLPGSDRANTMVRNGDSNYRNVVARQRPRISKRRRAIDAAKADLTAEQLEAMTHRMRNRAAQRAGRLLDPTLTGPAVRRTRRRRANTNPQHLNALQRRANELAQTSLF